MEVKNTDKANSVSRRGFLKIFPVGLFGAFTLGAFSRSLFKQPESSFPEFPEGSIFTPADKNGGSRV